LNLLLNPAILESQRKAVVEALTKIGFVDIEGLVAELKSLRAFVDWGYDRNKVNAPKDLSFEERMHLYAAQQRADPGRRFFKPRRPSNHDTFLWW
jgi:hypothetical protein